MKNKIKVVKGKILSNNRLIFYIVSILFAVTCSFINVAADDVGSMRVERGSLSDYWLQSVSMYFSWSSRVLVNFVVFIFTDNSLVLWAIYMGVSLFVLLNALSIIFTDNNSKEINCFIAAMVMMFPYNFLNEAGWIATMTTYLSPVAFGFMALVPIKKVIDKKNFGWIERIFYSISLLYASNNEQMMLILLTAYIVTVIYFIVKRQFNKYCIWLLLISIGSCIFTFTCPGNFIRKQLEIYNWYPTYGMLNTVDKIDIGFATTFKWLLFENNIFVIFTCLMLCFLIWRRYEDKFYRVLSLIPVLMTVLLGPLKSITISLYPAIDNLTSDIPYYGLVNPENRGHTGAFGQYFIMGTVILIICIEILLLQYSILNIVASITILAAGAASRMAISFSPTIYISGHRTCTVMSFCIIAVMIMVYSKNIENSAISVSARDNISFIMKISLIFSFINLWFIVYASFR